MTMTMKTITAVSYPRTHRGERAISSIPEAAFRNKDGNIVRENCVIFIENMQAGETGVWSETKSCPHIYHKDCMVAFLAIQRKRTIRDNIELDRNPCPTCRRYFVFCDGVH
jgi:hypothetical protein